MAATVPVPNKSAGDLLTTTLWNVYIAANLNKLLNQGHRVLTVAQFSALADLEDGDEVYLEVDAANGILWHLIYDSGEATYKWRFLGGPPMASEVATSETTASVTYAALATAGPSITLPRAGNYDVALEAHISNDANGAVGMHSYDIGGSGASDADFGAVTQPAGDNSTGSSVASTRRKTGLTAVALVSKYKVSGGTGTFQRRRMYVRPVRIRHDA